MTILIVPPRHHTAIRAQHGRVSAARADADNGFSRQGSRHRDECGCRPVRGISHAETSIGIEAPGRQRAVGAQGQGVVLPGGDGHDCFSCQSTTIDQDRAAAQGRAAVAEMTILIPAPGQHTAIGAQCQHMLVASGDGGHRLPRQRARLWHKLRQSLRGRGAIPHGAVKALSPGEQPPVRTQYHRVS